MDFCRFFALFAVLLIFCSCSQQDISQDFSQDFFAPTTQTQQVLNQDFSQNQDLILPCDKNLLKTHPADFKKLSSHLIPLLFQSLVSVNDDYSCSYDLAEDIQSDGLVYTITIKDAIFSDGSEVLASDVVDSFYKAIQASSNRAFQFSGVSEFSAVSKKVIRISLENSHRDFINLLTFPIAKQDANGNFCGSGRYILVSQNSVKKLIPNTVSSHQNNSLDEILLQELPNDDTLIDSLKIGKITCLFDDLSDGEAMNLSDKVKTVEIGHLVFLGCNSQSILLQNQQLRSALSLSLNREMIADRVYSSKALPVDIPFHPNYYRLSDYKLSQFSLSKANSAVAAVGLEKNSQGFYFSDNQDSLTLVYNDDNPYRSQMASLIKQQFEMVGIKVITKGYSYQEYLNILSEGGYDLYIGELAIDDSMDIMRLLVQGENYGFGTQEESPILLDYYALQQGSVSIDDFLKSYNQFMPAIPLLYRQGVIVVAPNCQNLPEWLW